MKKDFDLWLNSMTDSISSWKYYTDFEKVYLNVDKVKVELNILNSLIKSKNIEKEFEILLTKYPEILKVIPILIAKRDNKVIIKDSNCDYEFNFSKQNYSVQDYTMFMRKTGIFDLLENNIVSNLYDYVTGVEVGLDTNARKNRTGDSMEDLVESYLLSLGLIRDVNYFKEKTTSYIKENFGMDLSSLVNDGESEKRFDFVIKIKEKIFAVETNFYSSGGSKLNETSRSYKLLFELSKSIENFDFIWITDGIGWQKAKNNLKETYDIGKHIYNINDLKLGILKDLLL